VKILVVMYDLTIGGSTVTAIDFAAAVRDQRGLDVTILASPGPLETHVREVGLPLRVGPPGGCGIRWASARAIRDACREEQPDLVHAWDWKAIYTTYFVAAIRMRIPMFASVTSISPPPLVPAGMATTFVTAALAASDRARRPGGSYAQEAPIDTDRDRPGAPGVQGACFARTYGLARDRCHVVIVSRLARSMKAEGIYRAIDAVAQLARTCPVDLTIVGDGDSRDEIADRAQAVNVGREVVRLTGPLPDPRSAYDAADIVVGMGTSAGRAMAWAKPTVVVGEQGFVRTFSPATADALRAADFYGVGTGDPGNRLLESELRALVSDAAARASLGAFSRRYAVEHISAHKLGRELGDWYVAAAARPVERHPRWLAAALLRGARLGGYHALRKLVPAPVRRRVRELAGSSVRRRPGGGRSR
jgi:hypothetical protein